MTIHTQLSVIAVGELAITNYTTLKMSAPFSTWCTKCTTCISYYSNAWDLTLPSTQSIQVLIEGQNHRRVLKRSAKGCSACSASGFELYAVRYGGSRVTHVLCVLIALWLKIRLGSFNCMSLQHIGRLSCIEQVERKTVFNYPLHAKRD